MLARKVRTLKRKIEFRSLSKKQHEKQQRQHLVKKNVPTGLLIRNLDILKQVH